MLSVLFVGQSPSVPSSASTAVTSDTALLRKEGSLAVLAEVGLAMATDAEAGEELDEISAGDLAMQVCGLWGGVTKWRDVVASRGRGAKVMYTFREYRNGVKLCPCAS